tara:strand:+ start:794 stop:1048 length:255 start_codon:yes stop_codon:yes gene_type:complete
MKYVLIVYLCSFAAQTCDTGTIPGVEFNSYKDCAKYGYNFSAEAIDKFEEEVVNTGRLAVKFECREVKIFDEMIVPPPKPKTPA